MKKLGVMCMLFCMAMFVQAQELKQGDAMPGFELNSSVYGKVNSADLKGKVVLSQLFVSMFTTNNQHLEVLIILVFWPQCLLHFSQLQLARATPGCKQTDKYNFAFQVSRIHLTINR